MKLISVRSILLSLILSLTTSTAFAEKLAWPTVAYSANEKMVVNEEIFESKVYFKPKPRMIRRELDLSKQGAGQNISITDYKKKQIIILMPEMKMHMIKSFADEQQRAPVSLDEMDVVSMKSKGKESINGLKAKKYAVSFKNSQGDIYSGYIWKYKHGIIVKTELTDNQGRAMKQSLSNLKIGDQPSKLFKIPAEYKGNNTNIQDMMKNMMMK